jgi:diguanylate cyclase (GGDEF)-like protein
LAGICCIPDNETKRLRVLRSYEVLDSEPEPEFDALTRVAAHAFAVPIAVIAMVDSDRLWFKSRIGLAVPQLDRKIAFCAHTILRPSKLLVVEDLRSDARFAGNPLVTNAPHIRFYAGAAIVDHDRHALGTIAVIDTRPGTFSHAQRRALADLSSLAMTALQSRRRAMDLRRLAMTDYLTGIANRARFEASITAEVHTARQSGTHFNVFLLDLDGFKNVNDTFGHAAGDEVLRTVAMRLTLLVRQSDTLARLGGDEFGIVTRNDHDYPPDVLADRIRSAAEQSITLSDGNVVRVGISVGVASYTDPMSSADDVLALADRVLYEAKRRTPRVAARRGRGALQHDNAVISAKRSARYGSGNDH